MKTKKPKKETESTEQNENKHLELKNISAELAYKAVVKYDIVLVTDQISLKDAKKNIKAIENDKNDYKNRIKPLKSFLDSLHKKITGVEKENCLLYDYVINAQEEKIEAFKAAEFERQQEIERKARELAEARAAEEKAKLEEIARKEAAAKRREATRLEKQGASKKTIESLRAEAEEIRADAAEYDPGIVPEKVVLEKDRVRESFNYFIADESAFIAWALENNDSLLNFSINKKNFNAWIKNPENQNHPFIGREKAFK